MTEQGRYPVTEPTRDVPPEPAPAGFTVHVHAEGVVTHPDGTED